jgi:hypothetical protein
MRFRKTPRNGMKINALILRDKGSHQAMYADKNDGKLACTRFG